MSGAMRPPYGCVVSETTEVVRVHTDGNVRLSDPAEADRAPGDELLPLPGGDELGESGQDPGALRLEGVESARRLSASMDSGGRAGPNGVVAEGVEEGGHRHLVDLEVELQTPRPGPDSERLALVAGAGGEVDRTRWKVEGVPVPVQDGQPVGQAGQERVVGGLLGELDRGPARSRDRSAPGNTVPPPARARSWAPRHTPMVGSPRAIASASRSSSARRVGNPSSL